MENSTLGTKYRIWDRLSLKSVVRPFLMELPLHLFFMKLMGVKAVLALIMQRANALDEIDKYPTYLNLFGRIAILFLFAYIAATIITIIKNKVFKRIFKLLLYFLVVALFFVNAFIQMNFHLGITPTLFILLAETTASESSEFIQQYIFSDTMLPTLKILIISLVEIIVVEVLWSKIKKSRRVYEWIKGVPSYLTKILSIGVLSFLLFGIFSTNIYYRVHKAKSPDFVNGMLPPTDPLSSIYTSWVTLRMMSDNVADAIDINKMAYRTDGTYTTLDDSLNIVVVIGESYIKWHSQLYGYELATAPNMYREQQEGRLFVFNDVISSSKSTSISMRDIFSCNNNSVKEQWYNHPAFSAIFKKAGYNVYFWDNQRDFAKMETYSFTLNSFLYNPELQDIFYTQTNEKAYTYDAELVESFNSAVNLAGAKHNLVLLHLQGQHVAPSGRFPHDTFKHFTADSIKRTDSFLTREMKEYIADYDNATLYNDYVLNRIFEIYNESNSIVIYFSDHGEEAYDYRKQCSRDHGEVTAMSLKYQYEIPFVVWCSDVYRKNNPDVVDAIQQAVDRPFVLDNIHNLLFDLGNIVTSYRNDSSNIISPNYECGKRYIKLVDGDYIYEKLRYVN